MNDITILTPTYNRAAMLPNLYQSLLKQTSADFVWLIVDDGSTDGTRQIVEEWRKQALLTIEYVYRENGGKHRALNTGMSSVKTPLTFIVDSDDTLLPDAVREVERIHQKYGDRKDLCGYSFLKVGKDGASFATKELQSPEKIGTFAHVRFRENNLGDMAEVWFTSILRSFPFPEFANEKFYSEAGVWLRMSGPYQMVFVNKPVYECAYYADGLTRNRAKSQKNSPLGMLDCSKVLMEKQCGFRANLRGGLRYCVFARKLGMSVRRTLGESKRPWLTALCLPLSIPLGKRWK